MNAAEAQTAEKLEDLQTQLEAERFDHLLS